MPKTLTIDGTDFPLESNEVIQAPELLAIVEKMVEVVNEVADDTGTNTGDVTLTAVGSTPAAAGASLSGQALTLQPASGTHPGVLTTGAQTIAGAKTFSGAISASNLSGTNTGNVTLTAVGAVPNANGATLTGQALNLQPVDATHPGVMVSADKIKLDALDSALYATKASILKATLTPAAEDSDAIAITGVVEDLAGLDAAEAKQVMIRTLAVTADKGDISVTAGTAKKIVNPATGENVAWVETAADGTFAFSVANDQAEETLVWVQPVGGISTLLKLTFAA